MVPRANPPPAGLPIQIIRGLPTGLEEVPEVLVRYLWGRPPVREALWPRPLSPGNQGRAESEGSTEGCFSVSRWGAFSEDPQVLLGPPGYSGLPGEGSIPVPLPPPGKHSTY